MRIAWWNTIGLAAGVGVCVSGLRGASSYLLQQQESLRTSMPVVVFFQADLPDDRTRDAASHLKQRDSGIDQMTYKSRQQAYQEASQDPQLSPSLVLLRDNPFPASAEMILSAQAWRSRADPTVEWRGIAEVQEARWNSPKRDLWVRMDSLRKALQASLWICAILLLLWSLNGMLNAARDAVSWRQLSGWVALGCLGGLLGDSLWQGVLFRLFGNAANSFSVIQGLQSSGLWGSLIGLGSLKSPSA
jgi:cell division protein FtsX